MQTFAQKARKIKVVSAEEMSFDKTSNVDATRLTGSVTFEHENAYMYCDSAWLFKATNSLEAYGNVKIEQGDSLTMTGRFLSYNGNTKLAKVRDSVVLIHKQSTLYTDSLNFDRERNMGYYFNGGKIDHEDIDLKSNRGYYYPDNKNYYAVGDTELEHPDYTIFSDSLRYNTESRKTYFLASTSIVSDSSRIECYKGWFDNENNTSAFGENTTIYQEAQTIEADSIFYDRNSNDGKAWENVFILDTAENFAASGNYAEYNDRTNSSLITDSALVMYYEGIDTTYIHGDTVFLYNDSLDKRTVKSFYKVKIFKSDFQGRCDSLIYKESDSIVRMFVDPILWAEESQITADTIELLLRNNKAERVDMSVSSLIIMQEDSIRFSQISGENMVAYLKDNELSRIYVPSNAKTIYYVRDEKTQDIFGVNKEVSSEMRIFREEGKIQRIAFKGNPDGSLLPDDHTNPADMRLRGFVWHENKRPQHVSDVFIW